MNSPGFALTFDWSWTIGKPPTALIRLDWSWSRRFQFRWFALKCLFGLQIESLINLESLVHLSELKGAITPLPTWLYAPGQTRLRQDSAFFFRNWNWNRSQKFVKNRTWIRSHFLFSAVAAFCVVFIHAISQVRINIVKFRLRR